VKRISDDGHLNQLEGESANHHIRVARQEGIGRPATIAQIVQEESIMAEPTLVERALRDPEGVFGTPEAVVQSEHLPLKHKRTILERWQQLIGSPVSGKSRMAGELSFATRLARALAFLDTETGSHEATHNQGFYTSINDIMATRETTHRR
jgi:hypothetical protein